MRIRGYASAVITEPPDRTQQLQARDLVLRVSSILLLVTEGPYDDLQTCRTDQDVLDIRAGALAYYKHQIS